MHKIHFQTFHQHFFRKKEIWYNVDKIANVEKKVPLEWITNDGTYVSEALVDYIRPLIQAELTPIMIKGQPRHIVVDID